MPVFSMRVIELHSPVKIVQRGQGRTATAAAAYRSATRIHCERTGETHDYRRKKGVEHSTVLVSADAPEWALDRSKLWNAAELREKHPRAQPARDLEVSFPAEFNPEQRREAGLALGHLLVERYGVAADLCWHKPGRTSDDRNHHLHVLFTTRRFENGEWAKTKDRTLDDLFGKGKTEILTLRQDVAGILNNIAARDRLDVYVEHLSFEKRGLDLEATQHMGPAAAEMERDGKSTDIGEKNREIKARNTERKQLRQQYKTVTQAVAQAEQQPQAQRPGLTPDDLKAFYQDNQARRRVLLAELEAAHGPQEKEARQALEQMSGAPHEKIIGQWRKLVGKTAEEQALIDRHRATLEAIAQQRAAAWTGFERERRARLDALQPAQAAAPSKDKREERKRQITAIYRAADSAQALQAALAEAGFTIAQGDRLVLIDGEGNTYGFARQLADVKEKELRARLTGLALPSVDDTLKRLAAEQAKPPDHEAQAEEAEPMEPKQAEQTEAGRAPQQGNLRQEFAQAAPPPKPPPNPVNFAHLAERERLENERRRAEDAEAQRRLQSILDQRYGPDEQRLRAEIEPLETLLQGASKLKVRMLKFSGQLPQDAEERLAKLREEQALLEARRKTAAEILEKTQRENEEAVRQRQAQEQENARRRAPQMAPDFNAATQARQAEPESAPTAARANRPVSGRAHSSLLHRQLDELLQFSDDAALREHRAVRELEVQYKMTERDRQIAGAFGHARNDAQFEAYKKALLERLENEQRARREAIKARHEQERQNLNNGMAPPTPLAQKFEQHAPRPMEVPPAPKQQPPQVQPQQTAPPAPAKVQHPTPELRPPGMGKPAPQSPEEEAARRAFMERMNPPRERQPQPTRVSRQPARPAPETDRARESTVPEFNAAAGHTTTEEEVARQAFMARMSAQSEQEQSLTSEFGEASGAYAAEGDSARAAFMGQFDGGGMERGVGMERE